jgi:hypothetical protein
VERPPCNRVYGGTIHTEFRLTSSITGLLVLVSGGKYMIDRVFRKERIRRSNLVII